MSDLMGTLRRALSVFDASYPPGVLGVLPDPHINSLAPSTVLASAGAATVTVSGTDFEATSVVEVNGTGQATTFVNSTTLTISYDPTVAGTTQFTVRNSNGEESNSVPFIVAAGTATAVAEPEPESEDEPEDVGTFDPGEHTIEEIKTYLYEHPERRAEVIDAERAGKARTTLLEWLESEPEHTDPEVI